MGKPQSPQNSFLCADPTIAGGDTDPKSSQKNIPLSVLNVTQAWAPPSELAHIQSRLPRRPPDTEERPKREGRRADGRWAALFPLLTKDSAWLGSSPLLLPPLATNSNSPSPIFCPSLLLLLFPKFVKSLVRISSTSTPSPPAYYRGVIR